MKHKIAYGRNLRLGITTFILAVLTVSTQVSTTSAQMEPGSVPASDEILIYTCAADRLPQVADQVRGRFGANSRVRVATDQRKNQLFVLTPPSLRTVVEQDLAARGAFPFQEASVPPVSPEAAAPGTILAPPTTPGSISSTQGSSLPIQTTEFGVLPPIQPRVIGAQVEPDSPSREVVNSTVQKAFAAVKQIPVPVIESRLAQAFGDRLQLTGQVDGGGNAYVLRLNANRQVFIAANPVYGGLLLQGDSRAVRQLQELIESFDTSIGMEESLLVLPMRRLDPTKVLEAVDAYREGGQPTPAATGVPSTKEGVFQGYQPSGIQQVNHQFITAMANQAIPSASNPYRSANASRNDAYQASAIPSTIPASSAPLRPLQHTEEEPTPNQPILDPSKTPPAMPVSGTIENLPIVPSPVADPSLGNNVPTLTGEELDPRALREVGGDVQVEILPDLDVIILRGRQHDVDEMSRIIAEIERLSAETVPQIEVLPLMYVKDTTMVRIITQVSPDLIGGRQGRATVIPLDKPNALLLLGWGEAIKVIKALVADLDQPTEPEYDFRVFRLEHAAATTAGGTVRDFFTNRPGLGTSVLVTVDARTNSLIVRAAPRDMMEVANLLIKIDTDSSGAVSRAQIFKLKNALASELGATLQAAIDATRGGQAGKSVILEMLAFDAQGEQILRSGILADVRVVPDVRTNTLVLTAPVESMPILTTLIELLDSPSVVAQIKVFQIVNGDANQMVRMLQSLLPSQRAGDFSQPMLPSAEGESSLVPVRFAVDIRTNSIIATGSKGDLAIIEALLLRIDGKDVMQRQNTVYRLKNAPATDVARAINDFLRSERQVQRAAPGSESPFQQIEREVVVVPEPVSNSLIISATPRFFEDIEDLVIKLDAQPPQVMIQVLIAEVSLDNAHEWGVELGLQDSLLFDRSLLSAIETITTTTETNNQGAVTSVIQEEVISAENFPGFNFTNGILGNSGSATSVATANSVGSQGVSTFGVGRVNQELGYGGFAFSASSSSVSVLVRALQECRRLQVLSRPQIMTLDNQSAFIQVGQRVPRITGTTINATGQINNIEMEDVGLILGVTPRISPEGIVVMELDAEKSELDSILEGIPVAISDGEVIRSPSVNVTTAATTVSAASGETIVLGGLITKGHRVVKRRVPWLSDIPVLGWLFRYDSEMKKRTELLIVMTPWVVFGPDDAERLKQREAAKMSWCLSDVNEVHDSIGVYELGNDASYPTPPEVAYPDPLTEEELIEMENSPATNNLRDNSNGQKDGRIEGPSNTLRSMPEPESIPAPSSAQTNEPEEIPSPLPAEPPILQQR